MTELAVPTTVRNISNSEVTTFLACKRQYFYSFIWEITPKKTSDPLARGGIGHEAFEEYVKARLNGDVHEQAMKAGLALFERALTSGMYDLHVVLQTQMLWVRYMTHHEGWPSWKMLGTEERLDLPLTDTINMTMRYDLYFQDIHSGKHYILDYKFTYDFWQSNDHDLNGQMPKYIGVMLANNLPVDGGILEEIRTRVLGKDKSADIKNLWKRTPYYPTPVNIQSMLRQHVSTALDIERYRNLSETEQRAEAAGALALNKHGACKYCNFTDLCISEIRGKVDLTVDVRTGYTHNTYGYNQQQAIEDLL